jgi:hypothetical protein
MRVAPKHTPYTATQITADNIVELAQIHARELYITESATCLDWDADTILGPGDYIVTDAMGAAVDVCDETELHQNYITEKTEDLP